jgi:hypothetical protein
LLFPDGFFDRKCLQEQASKNSKTPTKNCDAPSDPSGPCVRHFEDADEQLDGHPFSSLAQKLEVFHKATGGVLLVGTGCSGTDRVVHAFRTVTRWWSETFGLDFTVKHKLSC